MSNTFDGTAEHAAILARLAILCDGRIYDGGDESYQPVVNTDLSIKPCIFVLQGQPIKTTKDRNLGKERVQPFILLESIEIEAASNAVANATAASVVDLLLDWRPSGTATGLDLAGGSSFPRLATQTKPVRQVVSMRFTTTINI